MFRTAVCLRNFSVQRIAVGTKQETRRVYSSRSLTNLRNKFVWTGLYADGVTVFGTLGFFYAFILTAGDAYDVRNNKDFSAAEHARRLFLRAAVYPVMYGLAWPGILLVAFAGEITPMYRQLSEKNWSELCSVPVWNNYVWNLTNEPNQCL